MKKLWAKSLLLLFGVFLFFGVDSTLSHSFVVDEVPKANSSLDVSPSEARVTFNSPIEKDLSTIVVINQEEIKIPAESPLFNDELTEIFIPLPALEAGTYKVEYYVVSSNDGHPISGSYSFHVETSTASSPDSEVNLPAPPQDGGSKEVERNQNKTESIAKSPDEGYLSQLIIFALRILYYTGLLLLIGWVFWWHRIRGNSGNIRKKFLFWGTILQMLHLVGLLSMIAMQLNIFTNNGLVINADFFVTSYFGIWWLVSLVLSILGFLLLFRYKWFDVLWLIGILISKSVNGHSIEIEPWILFTASNGIHLLAASIWASGLLFILVYWSKNRLFVNTFLPQFSRYALASILLLVITGIFSSGGFLYYSDFALTTWSLFLWLKILLVILVAIIGYKIRIKLKKKDKNNIGLLLKVDFTIMLTIIIVVSFLTYLNPQP